MKTKMDDLTKGKLMYSLELIIIAIIILVFGILKVLKIIPPSTNFHTIFNWLTLAGGCWVTIDFIWTVLSAKRKAKNCLLDKIITLPLGLYLICFDLFCLINKPENDDVYTYGICIVFFYIFIDYTFQGIYHWFKPHPAILEAVKEDEIKENNKNEQ